MDVLASANQRFNPSFLGAGAVVGCCIKLAVLLARQNLIGSRLDYVWPLER